MELDQRFKYTGKGDKILAILHPGESTSNPLWFVEVQDSNGLHYQPQRIGRKKIEDFLARHGKTMGELKWRAEKCRPFKSAPWSYPYAEKYELVYFIEAVGANRIKIGTTDTLHGRLTLVKTYCPYPPVIIGAIHGYKELEEEIHHKFKHLRKHGEWFEGTQELRDFIQHITKGQVVPEVW